MRYILIIILLLICIPLLAEDNSISLQYSLAARNIEEKRMENYTFSYRRNMFPITDLVIYSTLYKLDGTMASGLGLGVRTYQHFLYFGLNSGILYASKEIPEECTKFNFDLSMECGVRCNIDRMYYEMGLKIDHISNANHDPESKNVGINTLQLVATAGLQF